MLGPMVDGCTVTSVMMICLENIFPLWREFHVSFHDTMIFITTRRSILKFQHSEFYIKFCQTIFIAKFWWFCKVHQQPRTILQCYKITNIWIKSAIAIFKYRNMYLSTPHADKMSVTWKDDIEQHWLRIQVQNDNLITYPKVKIMYAIHQNNGTPVNFRNYLG